MASVEGFRGTPEERFAAKCAAPDENGCILWLANKDRKGYGRFRFKGRFQRAHRAAWEMANGPITDGLQIDHVYARGCRSTSCQNVAHMELVTNAVNMRRRVELQTHCVHGHEFAVVGQYLEATGSRRCRECCRQSYLARKHARKAMA